MNNAKKSLVPHRRFKEFQNAGAWEQRKLGDVAVIFDGTHQTPKYTDSGIKFVSVENIATLETEKYISQKAYENEYSNKQAEKGDILMTRIGNIGTAKMIEKDEPLAYYVTLALLKPQNIDSNFLVWGISSPEVQRNIWKLTLHIAFPKKINLGEISQVTINIPSSSEQKKIGEFFQQLDSLIALHQRKLNKLKKLKSAYLTEMFPDEGEHKPKRRFAGFTDDWEQRKLEDISIINPKSVIPEHFKYVDLESVVGTDLISFIETDKNSAPSRAQRVARTGDIFYQTVRPYQKNNYLFTLKDKDYVFSTGYAQIRSDVDNAFLMSYLQNENFVQTVLRHSTGTSYPAISPSDLAKISVFIPKKQKEQLKIGKAFSNIDNLITLHQRKIDKLQKLKNAYLNEMFV